MKYWSRMLLQNPPYKGYNEVVSRSSPLSRLQEVAQDQWGLMTRRQIEARGISQSTLERLTAPGGALERVATGVYRLAGAPIPDHLELRAAWLQLAPATPVWDRTPDQGVVSHRSAAAVYGLGDFPADSHDFTLPRRRQSRRPDVRIHVRNLTDGEWIGLNGLPVTRPSRIASDLLWEREDPEGVARLIADSIRFLFDDPGIFADQLSPHADKFGLHKGDGLGLMRWILNMTNDSQVEQWMADARAHADRARPKKTVSP
jgi:hypothetical protein